MWFWYIMGIYVWLSDADNMNKFDHTLAVDMPTFMHFHAILQLKKFLFGHNRNITFLSMRLYRFLQSKTVLLIHDIYDIHMIRGYMVVHSEGTKLLPLKPCSTQVVFITEKYIIL